MDTSIQKHAPAYIAQFMHLDHRGRFEPKRFNSEKN